MAEAEAVDAEGGSPAAEAPGLAAAIDAIVRGETTSLEPCLNTDVHVAQVAGTSAKCRLHVLKRDGNDRIMVAQLVDTLACRIVEYCIPRSRIDEAYAYRDETGDGRLVGRLHREAGRLFTNLQNSGEGGELLLYTLLESFLQVPQILCKMSLKTAENMHIHGADGVHAKGLEDGKLAVYWGESKLYGAVNRAIHDCMESLGAILHDPAPHRDTLLVRDRLDAGNHELTARLIEYFDPESPHSANLVVRGACLIGFTKGEDAYPRCPTDVDADIDDALRTAIGGWHERVKSAIDDHNLNRFEIEVFMLPFPSVADFRERLLTELGVR